MSRRRRLFVPTLPAPGTTAALPDEALHHARVLRLAEGARVVLFDGEGNEAEARLLDGGRCSVEAVRSVPLDGPRLVLCQALPKGAKLEAIVRATTEVGVAAIHLFAAERSVVRPDPARLSRRLARLEKIAQEAARQAGRAEVPAVHPPAPLAELLRRPPLGAARVAAVVGAPGWAVAGRGEAWVLVGPEGGLSSAEVRAAAAAGFGAISLGPHTLRVETAAPVACALVRERLQRRENTGETRG